MSHSATSPNPLRRSAQTQAQKAALPPRRDLFRPGFTVVANTLLDDCELRLSRSQQLFLNWTLRSTTGRQREWAPLSITALAATLPMSDTACYKSRDELQTKQVIEVREDVDGVSWVRLTPRFQPIWTELLDPTLAPQFREDFPKNGEKSPELGESSPVFGDDSCSDSPLRKKKERKEQQEQSKTALEPTPASPPAFPVVVIGMQSTGGTALNGHSSFHFEPIRFNPTGIEPTQTAQPCPQPAPPAAPAPTETSQPAACPSPAAPEVHIKTVLTPAQEHQARLLRQHGVAGPQSVKLALLHSVEAIARALEDLSEQAGLVCKPGAWLFSGLSSGRYQHEVAEAALPLPAPTSEAEQVRQRELRRSSPPDREAVLEARRQRQAEQDRTDRLWQDRQLERDIALLEQLPPAEYQHLEELARASLGRREPSRSLVLGTMLSLRQSQSSSGS